MLQESKIPNLYSPHLAMGLTVIGLGRHSYLVLFPSFKVVPSMSFMLDCQCSLSAIGILWHQIHSSISFWSWHHLRDTDGRSCLHGIGFIWYENWIINIVLPRIEKYIVDIWICCEWNNPIFHGVIVPCLSLSFQHSQISGSLLLYLTYSMKSQLEMPRCFKKHSQWHWK